MKILLSSHFFHPSVGGIEEVSWLLAHEFIALGHDVKVVTRTAAEDGTRFPFEVIRRPSPPRLLRLTAWCDVFFQNNISLRTAWPLLVMSRPWVVAHHTWIARVDGAIGWRDRLKQFAARNAANISVSRAMSSHISAPATIIGNPYRDTLFQADPNAARDRELVFLGRLVWDKGVDLLFHALEKLGKHGLRPRLTVIGSGAEEGNLRRLSARLGLEAQVEFAGVVTGPQLVALLNRHRLIVVPSRWQEPFGLVALEGIACGCVPVVARCGGLPDAVGPCGMTFEHEDVEDLARAIGKLLDPRLDLSHFRSAAAEHLARHSARAVALHYLRVLEEEARP
jgi:glycosyltransferase involved in cell wall biosynthesis